jgi:hypothetical protein
MSNQANFGTVKIHFTKPGKAIKHSVDSTCVPGVRDHAGKVRTWIAHVAKASPYETEKEVVDRIFHPGDA